MIKQVTFLAGTLLILASISSAQSTSPPFPQVSGWKLTVEETVYTPNNLWDVIDGAADLFLEYNFVDLRIARYQQTADLEIKVELYRHKSAIDAFGMYSQERYPDYHFIDLGTQGYTEKGILNLLSGEYYVKISTVQSALEAQDGLMGIARAVEKHLNRSKSWPELLAAFPAKGKQLNSEQYISKSFLGYSFFNRVFTASYSNGSALRAFIIRLGSPDEAGKTIDAYLASAPKDAIAKYEGGRFRVRDPLNGVITFVLIENTIYGVLGAESKDSDTLLNELGRGVAALK